MNSRGSLKVRPPVLAVPQTHPRQDTPRTRLGPQPSATAYEHWEQIFLFHAGESHWTSGLWPFQDQQARTLFEAVYFFAYEDDGVYPQTFHFAVTSAQELPNPEPATRHWFREH